MSRIAFPAVTALLSAAVFAGVWTATGATIAPATVTPMPVSVIDQPSSSAAIAPAAVAGGVAPATMRSGHARSGRRAHRRIARPRVAAIVAPPRAEAAQIWYSGCREVRAAGAAPLYRGQPGYRSGMDGDNDGIACEPYRGG